MEDELEVHSQPYDPAVPRICMDEMSKNLVKEKHPLGASEATAVPGKVEPAL